MADCVAVCCHHGNNSTCGHYTAFSRRGGSWFHYNDASRPSQVDAEKVTSDEGRKGSYMFFLCQARLVWFSPESMISRPVWSPWPSAQKDGKSNWLKGERIAVLIGARRSGLNCSPMLLYNSIILARKLAKIEMQMHKSHIRRVHVCSECVFLTSMPG